MQDQFQVPALIQGISTLKDKTLKLTVYASREMTADEKAKIFELEQCEGWFCFSKNSIQSKDIPTEKAEFDSARKSLSERLYNVLYVYWQQNATGKYPNFNEWRSIEMENIIESYKSRLTRY
jgi:hypothetical protein